jgi:hypothetical protein
MIDEAERINEKSGEKFGKRILPIVFLLFRTKNYLLARNSRLAEKTARRALKLANLDKYETNKIEADLNLSRAILANVPKKGNKMTNPLKEAEIFLHKASISCHSINLVEYEPDIILMWARIHFMRGNIEQAKIHANEALYLANRCEYRLKQADIHNFIAYIAKEEKDALTARKHATLALEIARCDGASRCYKPTMNTAIEIINTL